jgi:hypothetical protein
MRPLGRSKNRCEDNVRYILEKNDSGMDWIQLAKDRDKWRALSNMAMNL